MRKYTLISIIILLVSGISSCGSRTSQKEKTLQTSFESLKTTETVQNSNKSKANEQEQVEVKKVEISNENKSNSQSDKSSSENNSEKNNSEQNTKTLKKTTYFPNGQKKSETETNESFSKLENENKYYKAASESLREETLRKESEINTLSTQNKTLLSENETLLISNKTLLQEKKMKDLKINKETERKVIPFWLWIMIGFFIRILLGAFWKWFKTTSLFLSLPTINLKKS